MPKSKVVNYKYQFRSGTKDISSILGTTGNPQPILLIGINNYHCVMVNINNYMNNTENSELVIPPGHSAIAPYKIHNISTSKKLE